MYAWFVKDVKATACMKKLFMNPRCNLHEFWRMGHTQLYFRKVNNASPLYGGPGTLISDCPFDTFLFPKKGPDAGQMQFEWQPFDIAIAGVGKLSGQAWMGVHKQLINHVKINVPKLKELHEKKIKTAV